jgi:hypothetical protein
MTPWFGQMARGIARHYTEIGRRRRTEKQRNRLLFLGCGIRGRK